MDLATALVDVVIALWVFAVLFAIVRAWMARRPKLAQLAPETRNGYVLAWDRLATRFVRAPQAAVREADSLVTSLLREKGHPLEYDRLPPRLLKARRSGFHGQGRTEELRQAMLDYRKVVDDQIGPRPREKAASGRRSMA